MFDFKTRIADLTICEQSLALDPAKLDKATERARHMGITPPIQVRRLRDGYLLTDGLYRLRAAEALGLEKPRRLWSNSCLLRRRKYASCIPFTAIM